MIIAENTTVLFKTSLFKKKIRALDNFSIQINKGDIFGLLGPNGAGKSTAMYCFLGLIQPNAGKVSINGINPEPGTKIFEQIAYIPEEPHYHLYLTVDEILEYYANLYNVHLNKSERKNILEKFRMSEYSDLKLSKCSKGMKQKIGIACCLIKKVDIIFLDEPTRGLDPIITKEFKDTIKELNNNGVTFVINSHVLSEIETLCNKVAIINKGKVIMQDALNKIMKYEYDVYSIECETFNENIEYLIVTERNDKILRAEIPITKVADFFNYANERKIKIFNCSLKKDTLETAFFKILNDIH